jgi:copper homeostasis protein
MLVEVAVESIDAARAAAAGGADRIELVTDLSIGGVTPSEELTRNVRDDVDVTVFVMVRPRGGDFVYSAREIADMCATIETMRALGVHGIVAGPLTDANEIHEPAARALLTAAAGLPFTFHRAFDRVADQSRALEQLVDLGVSRVLTSGGAPTALAGADRLRALVEQAQDRIAILAGGGIRESNVRELATRARLREVHTRLTDNEAETLTAERVRNFRMALLDIDEE